MAVPNLPFWLSAANAEFSANGWGSNILSKAGVAVPGWCSQLAGKSAFVPTNTLTVGVSVNNNQWGWNPVAATPYGAFSPATTGSVTWQYFYVNAASITLSSTVLVTGTFEVTLATGASVTLRYNNLTVGSVIAGDLTTFISQVRAKAGSTLQVSIVKVASPS